MYTTAVFHISTCPQQLLSIVLCTCPLSCLSIVLHVHYSCCSYFYMSTKLLNLVLHAHYTVAVVHSSTSTFPLQLLSTVVHVLFFFVHCPLKLLSVVMHYAVYVHVFYSCCPQLCISTTAVVHSCTCPLKLLSVAIRCTCILQLLSTVLHIRHSCLQLLSTVLHVQYSCCP